MPYELHDTITAIASASGQAPRGIIRLSGPNTLACLGILFRSLDEIDLQRLARPTAIAGNLRFDEASAVLPCTLYLWPTSRSYTGQVMAEIHTLGSRPLLQLVLGWLCQAGARLAEPGEFTLRAFLAGRIDLTQAEAVLGVIDAADQRQFQTALSQLAGGLSVPLRDLRETLLNLLADLEAGLDFVEEDIEFITREQMTSRLDRAMADVARLHAQMTSRLDTDEAPRIVLFGWPNVGKSSLFNALAGNPAAIVSPRPGTTRDYLTATIDLDGLAARLVDTAGHEEWFSDRYQDGADPAGPASHSAPRQIVEAAQSFLKEQRSQAQLTLFCLDSTRPLNPWEQAVFAQLASDASVIIVMTKSDGERCDANLPQLASLPFVSVKTGAGLARLRELLRERLRASQVQESTAVATTSARCRESLRLSSQALHRAMELAESSGPMELTAAEIRLGLVELGKVAGVVYTDDMLDRLFRRFCIGK